MAGIDYEALHTALLTRPATIDDPSVSSLIQDIGQHLRRRYRLSDPDLATEAACHVVQKYLQAPDRYDLNRGIGLLDLLTFYARRRLLNELRAATRRAGAERPLAVAEHLGVYPSVLNRLVASETIHAVLRSLTDPRDRALLIAWFKGERRTDELCRLLGLGGLPASERRRIVKQARDRIRKHIVRWRRRLA